MMQRTSIQAAPRRTGEIVRGGTRGGGRPLGPTLRKAMEGRFGHDFSRVRIHADSAASESAQAVRATAYTVGSDIVFRDGAFSPETSGGQELLAHELTHVLQQQGSGLGAAPEDLPISEPGDASEREADSIANDVTGT